MSALTDRVLLSVLICVYLWFHLHAAEPDEVARLRRVIAVAIGDSQGSVNAAGP